MESPLEVLLHVIRALEEQKIAYVVVGSFASSARGVPRSTLDADIVADIKPNHVAQLFASLREKFYLDEQTIRRAIETRRSFNAIHFDSAFKVDVFIPKEGGIAQQQLARRRMEEVAPEQGAVIYVATAEDMVLAKLLWYQSGGGVSEIQWTDVLGMIRVQGEHLDADYLREWASQLGIRDLLERILKEAAII
jgi:predicted nucleotidyltransferase